ncbi:MAG: right-handed parallel beta-helix repeat-containing protein [Candidatus Bipolaricaulota bacterium]|nr:right-handed parallel beta-helix repeat-containing protein [Candidatus Bipolaricaulota bacterium]MDW8031219.1 right-handed parallel beta-helix repeat-containing protein [Candidatus Bipolaricaulota bacterium]
MRTLARLVGFLFLMGIAWGGGFYATSAGSSVIFVDCTLPIETPGNYKTLTAALQWARESRQKPRSEFGTIIVAPCTYRESLTGENAIDVKGLQWISRAGRDKTKIIGAVEIAAKNVLFVGFDVDADQAENALIITEDFAIVSNSKFHGAAGAGILVMRGAEGVILLRNEIFNNGGEGVKIDEASANLRLEENKIRSNGSIGVYIGANSDRAVISRNEIILNRGEGIFVTDNDGVEISNNELSHNAMDGIKLDRANGAVVLKNKISASGVYGITVQASDNNEIRENELFNNGAGGIALKEGERSAKRNTIQGNTISNHARAGAEGILLSGDVSGNVFLKNSVLHNSFGVKLIAQESGRAPSNNTFQENSIQESHEDGVSIQQSDGRNTFRSNEISGNNGSGISLAEGARNDMFVNNVIKDNGKHGVLIVQASRHALRENQVLFNGQAGISLQGAQHILVQLNEIRQNEREGLQLSGTAHTDLVANTIESNGWHGLFVQGARDLDARQNTISGNYGVGVFFLETTAASFDHNKVLQNAQGGIDLGAATSGIDIEFSDIVGNTQFGLRLAAGLDETTIRADRNWWGDPSGPSGVFEGRGNSVLGIRLNRDCTAEGAALGRSPCPIILPWLLAPTAELVENSITGWIFRKFGTGRAEFDATSTAGVFLRLYNVDANSESVVIVARYRNGFPQQRTLLENPVKVVSVLASGMRAGIAQLEVEYTDAEIKGIDESKLCLLYFDRATGGWKRLDCFVKAQANIVAAEIPVALLNAAPPIALATGAVK